MINQGESVDPNKRLNKPANRIPIAITAAIVGLGSVCMCFIGTILGAIAIIFATQADTKYNTEDYNGAESSSQVAYVLSIVSLSVSLFSILLFLFVWAIGNLGEASDISSEIDSRIIDRLF